MLLVCSVNLIKALYHSYHMLYNDARWQAELLLFANRNFTSNMDKRGKVSRGKYCILRGGDGLQVAEWAEYWIF